MQLLPPFTIIKLLILTFYLQLQPIPIHTLSLCKTSCGIIPINYPFALEDGCGAPQFRNMFNCTTTNDLFFQTPSGSYKVQSIDYNKKNMVLYDPSMSTCSILQPHHDFLMTDIQTAIIPPSQDTVFVLLNCSVDSPVLNHYKYLCFNFEGHTCEELYGGCNAFRVFNLWTNSSSSSNSSSFSSSSSSPPCCFTNYNTLKFMSMNILDCTHYTSVFNSDKLKGVGPLDWIYGIKLSFSVPDVGCESCRESGGSCGFDTDTEGLLCLCSSFNNSTRECGKQLCFYFELLIRRCYFT